MSLFPESLFPGDSGQWSTPVGGSLQSISIGVGSAWVVIFAVRWRDRACCWTSGSRRFLDVECCSFSRLTLVVAGMVQDIQV